MGNEIIKGESEGLVKILGRQGANELMEPLIKKIHLFDTYVAGTTHVEDRSAFDDIKSGDELTLRREEDNFYDDNAIMIFSASGKKLGYVPEKDNVIFSRLMDAGKMLKADINDIQQKGNYWQIKIGIYLVDY